MSELAKSARAAMKKKAAQMGKVSTEKVDSSDWTPAPLLNADKKTGLKPISRRAFKSGGKVEGQCSAKRADKMPRKGKLSGGALGRYAKAATKSLSENAEDAGRYGESYERSGDMDFVDAQIKSNRKQYNRVEGIKRAVDKLTGKAKVNAKDRPGKLSGGALGRYAKAAADDAQMNSYISGSADAQARNSSSKTVSDALGRLAKKADKRTAGVKMAVDKLTGKAKVNADGHKDGGRLKRQDGGSTYSAADKAKLDAMIREAQKSKDISKADNAYEGRAPEPKDLYTPEQIKRLERGYKKGGRVGKNVGGGMDPRLNAVPTTRMKFAGAQGTPYKKGGKVSHIEWEHSKADLSQDKKLAKKHGMSLEAWEKSKLDEKHDRQQSTKGLKSGGKVEKVMREFKEGKLHSGSKQGPEVKSRKQAVAIALSEAGKSRKTRAEGGKVKKGKTNINIVIAQPGKGDGMPPMPPGGPMGRMPGAPVPMPVPPAAGVPGAMGAMPVPVPAPAANIPPATMQRKAGGRVTKVARSYADMQAGAGSGEGRLQKTDIAKRLPKPRENGKNVYEGDGYPNKVTGASGGRTAKKAGGATKK